VQDFILGKDTSATRRVLAGFDPDLATESFGISPHGSHITLADREQIVSLMPRSLVIAGSLLLVLFMEKHGHPDLVKLSGMAPDLQPGGHDAGEIPRG
jgi:hypothetical protein